VQPPCNLSLKETKVKDIFGPPVKTCVNQQIIS